MQKVIKIISWILGILVGFMVVIAASVIIDQGMGVNRLDGITNTVIPNGSNPAIRAYVARPSGTGPFPVVIMVHEWWGLKAEIAGKADALAKDGYIVVAPNLFRGNTTDWFPTAIWQVSNTPTTQIDGDLDAVLQWINNQPDANHNQIAIMGFCFGGGTALRYSVNTPAITATAVFYGSVITDPAKLKKIQGPVLGIFGGADTMIPQKDVAAFDAGLTAAGIPHQVTTYDGEPHAFVKGIADINKGGNQQKAWNQLREFLAKAFSGQAMSRQYRLANHQQPIDVATQQFITPNRWLHQFVCDKTVK
jgi:carboxymethylenebutenolidase